MSSMDDFRNERAKYIKRFEFFIDIFGLVIEKKIMYFLKKH